MRLFTVCNHSPNQVREWLQSKFSIVVSTKKPNKKTHCTLFYYDLSLIKQHLSLFHAETNVILFIGPIGSKSLADATALDIIPNSASPYYGIQKANLSVSAWKNAQSCTSLNISKYEHADTIISVIESKSILNSLMTTIYELPSSSQKITKVILVNWMYHDGKISSIDKILSILAKKIRIKSVYASLLSILNYELMHRYIKALHSTGTIEEIAEQYSVSEYDLRYLFTVKVSKKEYLSLIKES